MAEKPKPPREIPKPVPAPKPGQKKLRNLTWLKIVISVALIAGAAVLALRAFSDVLGPALINFRLDVVKTEKKLSVDGLFLSDSPDSELVVLEFVEKKVFPFDYVQEPAEIDRIIRRAGQANGGRTLEEVLGASAYRTLQAYNLAMATGFDPRTGGSPFIVLTLVYRFGYRLDEQSLADWSLEPVYAPVTEPGTEEKNPVYWNLAVSQPQLLGVEIEDTTRDSYGYPDTSVSADRYRRISSFVLEDARKLATVAGPEALAKAMDLARTEAGRTLRALAESATGQRVEFRFLDRDFTFRN